MDSSQFPKDLISKAARLERYVNDEFPVMAVNKTLRFIDQNFRDQGWRGRGFSPWRKTKRGGTILVKSGRLRRSFHSETGPGMMRIWSDAPYSRVHNRGFNGTVAVKGFTRYKYTETKTGTGRFTKDGRERTRTTHKLAAMTQVQAHQRHMNITQRQFAPESPADAPVLMADIKNEVIKEFKTIFR
jgi:phage gpG-like protein